MKAFLLVLVTISTMSAFANSNYTFSRLLPTGTRGGTTTGVPVTKDLTTPTTWQALQAEGISNYERDRRAILALQGEYEVSFEFLETFLIDSNKSLDTPYFSKATEFVRVIADKGDFISLQHIIVLFYLQNGEVQGPIVTKHWRQDWKWEAKERFIYQGDKTWKVEPIETNETKGKWTWSVYQVDDSPRYTGIGKWTHLSSASIFETNTLSRPLPRREFSVRNDYKLLMGNETLVLTKNKWFHEQKAFKHQETLKDGEFHGSLLAREVGQNSYVRIKDFDWSAGLNYWEKTAKYWTDVRTVWKELFEQNTSIQLIGQVDGRPLYAQHFEQAENPEVLNMTSKQRHDLIKKTIQSYIK